MASSPMSATRALRPTLVVAEALIDRQNPTQIADRARELGLSPILTTAVVGVCCGEQHCSPPVTIPSSDLGDSAQS